LNLCAIVLGVAMALSVDPALLDEIEELLPRANKEEKRDIMQFLDSRNVPAVKEGLFDKQLDIFNSDARRITAVCGRRGGKTTTMGRKLVQTMADHPAEGEDESLCVFAAPTKNQARRLMWGRLQAIAEKNKVPISFSATQLIATHDNGAQCWIMGLDDFRDIERLRGFAFRLICIDEAQSLAVDVHELVDDIIDPALGDYDGQLIFTGTPNAACHGFFYLAATGQLPNDATQYENHTWTILDNPMFPRWRNRPDWREKAAAWMEGERKRKGWSEDNATYLREWMARWIKDTGSLIYRYDPTRNGFSELPTGETWRYVVGVDLGYNDSFAYVVLAFSDRGAKVYAVDEFEQVGLIPAQWAEHLQAVTRRYKPEKIMVDTGGMGKAVMEEFRSRYQLPVHTAEKRDKYDFIAHQNSDMHEASYLVKPDSRLATCYTLLQYDEKRKKEDPRMHHLTNLTDAGLYGWREAKHWVYTPTEKAPEVGTEEHWNRVAERMKDQRKRNMRRPKKSLLGN